MQASRVIAQVLGTVLVALSAAVASAQSYGPPVGVETARKIAAAAVAEAKANKWKVAVAVVDTHGALVFFERIDDTQLGSLDIALDKARAAAKFRRPSRVWEDAMAKGRISVMTLSGVVASPGGVPIMSDGKVIGAVGVSGATGDQDEQCAKAGVGAM